MRPTFQRSTCRLPSRLAFAPPTTLVESARAAPTAPSPQFPPPIPLSALTPAERLMEVTVATTSNLLNGAIFGAIFGFVSGAWSTRSLRGGFTEAKGNGRSWAMISAVYAGLQTASKVIRNREDRFNSVIGACGSGAAFSAKGGPRAAAQGCVSFAALSYIIDMLTGPKQPDNLSDEAILNKR